MASPLGGSDFYTSAPGAITGNDGSISGLTTQNQSNVTTSLQAQASASPAWNSASTTFFGSILGGFLSFVGGITYNIDEFLASLCEAITGLTGGFIDLSSWATTLQNNANEALGNTQTISSGISGSTDPSTVGPVVAGIQDNITSASSAIAALQVQATSGATGGISITDAFPTAEALSSDPSWAVGGQGATGTLTIESPGVVGLPTVNAVGTVFALNTTALMTDEQSVSVVAASASGTTNANTFVVCRASSGAATFVFFAVDQNTAAIGYGTTVAGVPSATTWASASVSQASGQTVTLEANGQTYTGYINGVAVVAHTDTAVVTPVGSSNRYVGWGMGTGTNFFGSLQNSWNIASFAAADISSPPVLGTGWSIFQGGTSSVGLPSGAGWCGVGAGTFDTEAQIANATITSLGYGVVTIQKPGWYVLSIGFGYSSIAAYGGTGVYYTPYGGSLELARQSNANQRGDYLGISGTEVMYLYAGDQVSPATYASGPGLVGNGAGSLTYFVGTLLSS